ncbi:MAG: hypothetical protein U1E36_05550 [Rickettsiales bacterium]
MMQITKHIHAIVLLCLSITIGAIACPSFAHSPYLVPYASFDDYNGSKLTVYGWYGDGIMITDPVAVVVLDEQDNLYAQTEVAVGATVLCLNSANCWVFLQNGVFPFSDIYRLSLPENYIQSTVRFNKDYPERIKPNTINFTSELIPLPFIEFLIYPATNLIWFLPLVLTPIGLFIAGMLIGKMKMHQKIIFVLQFVIFGIASFSVFAVLIYCIIGKVGLLPYVVISLILGYIVSDHWLRKLKNSKINTL